MINKRNLILLAIAMFFVPPTTLVSMRLVGSSAVHVPEMPFLLIAVLLFAVPALLVYPGYLALGARITRWVWLALTSLFSGMLAFVVPVSNFAVEFSMGSIWFVVAFSLFFGCIAQVAVNFVLGKQATVRHAPD